MSAALCRVVWCGVVCVTGGAVSSMCGGGAPGGGVNYKISSHAWHPTYMLLCQTGKLLLMCFVCELQESSCVQVDVAVLHASCLFLEVAAFQTQCVQQLCNNFLGLAHHVISRVWHAVACCDVLCCAVCRYMGTQPAAAAPHRRRGVQLNTGRLSNRQQRHSKRPDKGKLLSKRNTTCPTPTPEKIIAPGAVSQSVSRGIIDTVLCWEGHTMHTQSKGGKGGRERGAALLF